LWTAKYSTYDGTTTPNIATNLLMLLLSIVRRARVEDGLKVVEAKLDDIRAKEALPAC
jgi:hypothetical protein